jgi:membrane-associated phospholipid phosphatase
MFLAWQTRNRRFFWLLMPFYVLLCLSTVYIYAHYAIDVLAGWLSAVLFFLLFHLGYKYFIGKE